MMKKSTCLNFHNTDVGAASVVWGVSVLTSGTRVRGFKPGRSRRIFRAKKSSALPSVPCRTSRHVKDPKMARKSSFRLNLSDNILAREPTRISRVVQTWRYLAAKVGMSKSGGK